MKNAPFKTYDNKDVIYEMIKDLFMKNWPEENMGSFEQATSSLVSDSVKTYAILNWNVSCQTLYEKMIAEGLTTTAEHILTLVHLNQGEEIIVQPLSFSITYPEAEAETP